MSEEVDCSEIQAPVLNKSDDNYEKESTVVDSSEKNGEPPSQGHLSKREKKRLLKKQQWLDTRQERRAKEKEKRKKKMADRKENGDIFESTRIVSRKALKACKMEESKCKVGVVFDFQFGDLMIQRDLGKALKQVMKCYSLNRRLENPLQMHISSLEGRVAEEMKKHDGYENWDVKIHSGGLEVFPHENLVYLSSDSDDVLKELEPSKVYVIGALVDHNHHKGVSQARAKELNLATARLPIDDFIQLNTRKVLTINHVFEIMAEVTQGQTWKDAFLRVIPDRKGKSLRRSKTSLRRSKTSGDSSTITCDDNSGDSSTITCDDNVT